MKRNLVIGSRLRDEDGYFFYLPDGSSDSPTQFFLFDGYPNLLVPFLLRLGDAVDESA